MFEEATNDETLWQGYEEWLEEQAARAEYERMMENEYV